MLIAQKLREYRQRNDITQKGLADELGVSQQTVARWENGKATPSISVLSRIAEFFKVPMSELYSDEHDKTYVPGKLHVESEVKEINAAVLLVSMLELRGGGANKAEIMQNCQELLKKALRGNEDYFNKLMIAIGLVLDSFIVGALELSKLDADKAIAGIANVAGIANEGFNESSAYRKAKDAAKRGIEPMAEMTYKILMSIPDTLLVEPAPCDISDNTEKKGG